MSSNRLLAALALVVGAVMVVAACGSGTESAAPTAPVEPPAPAPAPVAPAEPGAPAPAPAAPVEPAPVEPAPVEPAPIEPTPVEPVGGVVRIGWEGSFDFTSGFDPTGEYLGEAYGIMSNLLVRTLVGYKHVAGPEGNVLVPDLATDFPEVSDDGLTYTFRLKDGIMFGPPLSREITSEDVRFAFERIGTPSVVAQYGFYYMVIDGFP